MFSPALAGVGPALAGLASASLLFLWCFQASFRWFFFFLLFHTSMMSDLSVDVVDAHDAVVSEGHPVSTLRTLLNAVICCLQLNTQRVLGRHLESGLLVIDAVGLRSMYFVVMPIVNLTMILMTFVC
jgi:hypothetical protein